MRRVTVHSWEDTQERIIRRVTAGRIHGEGSSGELQLGGYVEKDHQESYSWEDTQGRIIRRVTAGRIRREGSSGELQLGG
jgi:hypothetical protein